MINSVRTAMTRDLTLPVSASRDHVRGEPDAPLTLLEYGDFECPHCAVAHEVLKAVRERMGRSLRFAFRNFPLNQLHPHAQLAAEAAEAAGAQGKFWEMHDALFENQERLGRELLLEKARTLGLDERRFASDLSERRHAARVRDDFSSGVESGIDGTPGLFINGSRYEASVDEATLVSVLSSLL